MVGSVLQNITMCHSKKRQGKALCVRTEGFFLSFFTVAHRYILQNRRPHHFIF